MAPNHFFFYFYTGRHDESTPSFFGGRQRFKKKEKENKKKKKKKPPPPPPPGVALRASLVGIAVSTQYHERRRRLGASARPIVSGEPMATPDSVEE